MIKMLEDDDDQLLWLPQSRNSEVELPLNLRPSATRLAYSKSYSSRISSIFSTDSNPEADDDPFDLKRMKTFATPGPQSGFKKQNEKIERLIDIDSDSPNPREASDLSSKFLSAIKSLQNESYDDSFLTMKLCDSDIFEKSPEKNASLTDWDLLKNEAQAIAGKLKLMPSSPRTPSSFKNTKPLDFSILSPGLPPYPIDQTEELGILGFSPGITSTQKINFDELKLRSQEPLKSSSMGQKTFGEDNNQNPRITTTENLVTASDSKIASLRALDVKENYTPNVNSSCPPQKIFIDDQLEKAIKASRACPQPLKKVARQSLQTPFKSGFQQQRRVSSAAGTNKLGPLNDKSLLSSTPLIRTQKHSTATPLRMANATPIKPAFGIRSTSFATPQCTTKRIENSKDVSISSTKKAYDNPKPNVRGRLSLATPCTPSRLPFPSLNKPASSQIHDEDLIKRNHSALSSSKAAQPRKSLLATPVISSGVSRSSELAKISGTSSKLQVLKQSSILRSKLATPLVKQITPASSARSDLTTKYPHSRPEKSLNLSSGRVSSLPKPLKLAASKSNSK